VGARRVSGSRAWRPRRCHQGPGCDDPEDEADLIISSDGNDSIEGGRGEDVIFDYRGSDLMEGGDGDDYNSYSPQRRKERKVKSLVWTSTTRRRRGLKNRFAIALSLAA
jgi:hypothetical protein